MKPSDYGLSHWRMTEHDRQELVQILNYKDFEEIKDLIFDLPSKYNTSSLLYFIEQLKSEMEKTEGATHLAPQGISEEDMLKFVESKCVQFGIWCNI